MPAQRNNKSPYHSTIMTMARHQRKQEQPQQRQRQDQRQGQQESQDSRDLLDLFEESQSKTLLFTTSTSSRLLQTDGRQSASTGIYQCTLEPENNFDDFNSGDESRETCHVATKLGDGNNFVRTKHQSELVLRNPQFDLSSLRSASSENANANANANAKKKNYLYANTHAKYGADQESDWEIIRAELPQKGDLNSDALNQDGTLRFESVFRTVEAIDWNECDFDCCVKNDKINQKWEEDANYEYRHAYVQTIARSFVVDEVRTSGMKYKMIFLIITKGIIPC
jgi:hypothetical protein